MPLPTEAYLKELIEARKQVYAKLYMQIKANRDLRYRRNAINIPDTYKTTTQEVHVPIIADVLFRVVATLTTDDPVISVPPYAATEKAKRNASLRERWSQAALKQMMQIVNRDVLRMGVDAAVSDSLGVFKLVDRKDVWRGFPKRKKGKDGTEEDANDFLERTDKFAKGQPFPLVWDDVDPLTVMTVPRGPGKFEVLESTRRPLIPTMQQFSVYRNGLGGFTRLRPGEPMPEDESASGQEIDMVEHWSADGSVVSYMIDGKIADQRVVNYGRPPYFIAGGHMTSSRKPEEMYQSVIQPFAHLIPALEAMLTMMTNWGFFAAYPFLVKEDPQQDITAGPGDPTNVTKIEPGTVLQNVRFLEAPSTSAALKDLVGLLNQMIDRSGLAAVMYGQGASSSSGYMVSQLMTAAQLVYAPIIDNFRMALEQMIPFMWQLIERRMKRKVFVWGEGTSKGAGEWMGLGPDDIDGYYACEVALKPLLPMDEIAQRDSALRMVEGGLWSKEHAREHIGLEQPEEEADEIAVEQYMDSPRINELLIEDAARRAGLIKPEPPPPAPSFTSEGEGPPVILGPDGMPIQQGAGGPGMPPIQPSGPMVPGVNGMPLVPPTPQGAGGPPVGLQRGPGGPRLSGSGPI